MRDNHNRNIRSRKIAKARLHHSLADQIGRTFRRLNAVFAAALKPYGISPVGANILAILWVDGPMRIGMLQQRLAMNSSTFTGAVDRLERAGFIVRTPAPGDRRATVLEPFDLEDDRRADIEGTLLDTEELLFSALTGTEKAELGRLLRKLDESEW